MAALAAAAGLAGCVDGAPSAHGGFAPAAVLGEPLSLAAPQWRVGDRWTYSDGYGLEVDNVTGDLTRFRRTDDARQWQSRRGFLRQDSQSATTLRSVVFRSLAAKDARRLEQARPMVFTREFRSGDRTLTHSTSWVLEGRERVSVPAGDFDAFVIVMRTRNPDTGWTGFERWWYAPEARNYVRLEYRYGDQPVGSRVLTDYFVVEEIAAAPQRAPKRHQVEAAPPSSGQVARTAPPSASQGPNGSSSAAAPVWPFVAGDLFDVHFVNNAPTP